VAKKGAICQIFEGDMPSKKNIPQKVGRNITAITGKLLIGAHANRRVGSVFLGRPLDTFNSFPVMAVILRPTFGGIFFSGAYLPQKSDILPPF
jgi:hypothetical protein